MLTFTQMEGSHRSCKHLKNNPNSPKKILIMIDEQVCGMGSCSCFSGATVCDSCYHGSDFKMMLLICSGLRVFLKNQENLVVLVSGLGATITCGQSNCTESPLKPHRCGNRVVITLKILMPLGLLRNEMIKK